jgi:signal transduction histidine kinase
MPSDAPFESVEEAARLFSVVENAKKEWETTFDAFADGIGILRRDGTFKRANTALAALVGRDVRELPGSACCEAFPHHKTMGCPSKLESGHRQVEIEVTAPWRRVYRESAYAVPGLDTVVVILTDITSQRLADERIRKLHEEAMAANRELVGSMRRLKETQERLVATEKLASLATMAAGLAHEVNNPLAFVSSGCQQLREWAERLAGFVSAFSSGATKTTLDKRVKDDDLAKAGPETHAILADVHQGLERIRRIVNAFSTFVDQGQLAVGPVDVNGLVRDQIAEVQGSLPQGATVATALQNVPRVDASEAGVRTVVRQLLDNAVWALEGIGRPGRIVVGTSVRNRLLVVTVQDNGRGMAPDVVARAVDPFYTSRAPGPHVGLGLTIAQAIVHRLGGELSMLSEAGAGTSVEFTVPLDREVSIDVVPVTGPATRT